MGMGGSWRLLWTLVCVHEQIDTHLHTRRVGVGKNSHKKKHPHLKVVVVAFEKRLAERAVDAKHGLFMASERVCQSWGLWGQTASSASMETDGVPETAALSNGWILRKSEKRA
jgi:hypothetical protein